MRRGCNSENIVKLDLNSKVQVYANFQIHYE